MKEILLLGASGYIGSAFSRVLQERKVDFLAVPRESYMDWNTFFPDKNEIDLVINCAAFIPKPSVVLCDQNQEDTIRGNVLLPAMLARICSDAGVALAHISTGCLWSDGQEHSEDDPIQRAFTGHCGFYVGTKVLAEQEVRKAEKHYIWRIRLPFDEFDNDRNYLAKLANFDEVWNQTNSISHRLDFVKACLDLWSIRAPFGTYHVSNRGSIETRKILTEMLMRGIIKDYPNMIENKSGECKLSVKKLLSTGVKIRHVEDALIESLDRWK